MAADKDKDDGEFYDPPWSTPLAWAMKQPEEAPPPPEALAWRSGHPKQAALLRDGDIRALPYDEHQLEWLNELSDEEVLLLLHDRQEEVRAIDAFAKELRISLRYLVFYAYKRRYSIEVAAMARSMGVNRANIHESFLGKVRGWKRRPKLEEES